MKSVWDGSSIEASDLDWPEDLESKTEIRLQRCRLSSLDTLVERAGQSLEELYVDHNEICVLPTGLTSLVGLQVLGASQNGLEYLPKILNCLSKLNVLQLSRNRISQIELGFGFTLRHLQALDLSGNRLTQLPAQIEFMESLTLLNVRCNRIEVLPDELGALSRLRTLNLRCNLLSNLPGSIVSRLGATLKFLDLRYNKLRRLPEEIGMLTDLHELSLYSNRLIALPNSIALLERLFEFNIGENPLIYPPLSVARSGINNLRDYILERTSGVPVSFNCDSQNLSRQADVSLPKSPISSLNLSRNRFGSFSITNFLPSNVLSVLTMLNLSYNSLESYPAGLVNCSNLVHLDLSFNHLRVLPSDFDKLVHLGSLNLASNRISGGSFAAHTQLHTLNLSRNCLESLPMGIYGCSSLIDLNISFNRLINLRRLCANWSLLETFLLSYNQLFHLPEEIASIKRLRVLKIDGNHLQELSDKIFSSLVNLSELSVSDCKLKVLPAQVIPQMNYLTTVNARCNSIETLPGWIGQLPSLRHLDVGFNYLKEIPQSLTYATALTSLDIRLNNLTSLPSELGRLPALNSVILYGNPWTQDQLDVLQGVGVIQLPLLQQFLKVLKISPQHVVAESVRAESLRFAKEHGDPVEKWSAEVVCLWLSQISLAKYLEQVRLDDLTGASLIRMQAAELKSVLQLTYADMPILQYGLDALKNLYI